MNSKFRFIQHQVKLHRRRKMAGAEWRKTLGWVFPYEGHTLSNPQYIKDREKLFKKNGNGWWCNYCNGHYLEQRKFK